MTFATNKPFKGKIEAQDERILQMKHKYKQVFVYSTFIERKEDPS